MLTHKSRIRGIYEAKPAWMEERIKYLETDNKRLREAMGVCASLHLPERSATQLPMREARTQHSLRGAAGSWVVRTGVSFHNEPKVKL